MGEPGRDGRRRAARVTQPVAVENDGTTVIRVSVRRCRLARAQLCPETRRPSARGQMRSPVDRVPRALERRDRDEQQINDEDVVGEGLLDPGTVGTYLSFGFACESVDAALDPACRTFELGRERADDDESYELANPVVVG